MNSANHFANNMAKIAIGAKVANYNTSSRIVWTIVARKRYETSFTITLRRGRRQRNAIVPEARAAMGFPAGYVLPDNQRLAMHMLGNAVCPPVARDVLLAIKEAA